MTESKKGGLWQAKMVVMSLLMLALLVWVGLLARNTMREYDYIGVPLEDRNMITVSGMGKATGIPDIATVDLGVQIERATVGAAQDENTRVMNAIHAALDEFGIDRKDVKTSEYSIYPRYDYVDGKSMLAGYTVTQRASVKIRDLAKVGDVLRAAGEAGANQVGSISFSIDEPEALENEARVEAFDEAKRKAQAMAEAAGVELVRVTSFSESTGGGYPVPMYAADRAMGLGGGGSPTVEAGSSDVIVNVSMTYEIK